MAVNKMTLLFCFCCFASWLSGRAGSGSLTRKLLYECDLLPAPVLCTHRYSISPQSGDEHTDSVFPFGARPESFNHPKKHALPTKWQIITHYCCRLLLCRSCWITADACRSLTLSLQSDGKKLEENCGLLFLSQVE